jgi:hypothetical protein
MALRPSPAELPLHAITFKQMLAHLFKAGKLDATSIQF